MRLSATERTIAGSRSQRNLLVRLTEISRFSTVTWRITAIRIARRLRIRPMTSLSFMDMLKRGKKGKTTWLKMGRNITIVRAFIKLLSEGAKLR